MAKNELKKVILILQITETFQGKTALQINSTQPESSIQNPASNSVIPIPVYFQIMG